MQRLIHWLCFMLSLPALGAELTINFSDVSLNEPPPGFTNIIYGRGKPGDWQVIMDDVKPLFEPATPKAPVVTKQPVLAQLSRNPIDERFPILLYDKDTFGDFTLTTRFKIVDGVLEQLAGIVFRVQNETNFYVIRANAFDHTLRYYKVIDGARTPMVGPTLDIERNVWYELKIECKGNKFRAWLNDKEAMPTIVDSSFPRGKIGFWTKSDAISYFTDMKLTYVPTERLAQVIVRDTLKKYPHLLGLKITTLDADGEPRVIASNDPEQVGTLGTKDEKSSIESGVIFYGRDKKVATVQMPLRDRNGDPVAAVSVLLKPFKGQTQQNAFARATPIVKEMQLRVTSHQDLVE